LDELLLFTSYEVNFWPCARQAGFTVETPNSFREVRSCLIAGAETISCDGALEDALLRAEGVAAMDQQFASLVSAAANLRRFCSLRPPKSALQVERALVQGEWLTPIDALVEAERQRWRQHNEHYAAERFMVIICTLTDKGRGGELWGLEKSMCVVEVPPGGR